MKPTGYSLIFRGLKETVKSPQTLINVHFPQKTVVTSAALLDRDGKPTYRKDIYV